MTQSIFTIRLGVLLSVLLLAAVLAWSACGGDEDEGNGALAPTPLSEFPSLGARLEVPPSVPLGVHVPLKLTVENVTEAPVQFFITGREDYNFPGGYDFVVTTADGPGVWHWLRTLEAWALVVDRVRLGPGEQLRFEQSWPQADNMGGAVEPGTYLVHAVLDLGLEAEVGEPIYPETEATELVISP
jgi:hypothetical protein